MEEYEKRKSYSVKIISIGIAIIVFYIWSFIGSGSLKKAIEGYEIITKDKITTVGQIINVEEFEEEHPIGNKVDVVSGYYYKYSFNTNEAIYVESFGKSYSKMPLNKSIKDIPFKIDVEYIESNPDINRVKNDYNNDSLFQWFKQRVLLWLLGFIFCLFIAYRVIRGGIGE
jgi:hypothetical protein